MEQQNQDTLKQGLFDFEQAAPWVRLPEEAKGASPREESEREGQVFEAWREKLNWEERLLEKIANTANLEAASESLYAVNGTYRGVRGGAKAPLLDFAR